MLKQQRLDSLADGIFAIVMTILVLEIKVPELIGQVTDLELIHALIEAFPLVISYFLSFTLLYIYWQGQHYIASIYARSLDTRLASINALFLMLVALVPFSTHFLGLYAQSQTAIVLYGGHMILISLTLLWMRIYIRESQTIENEPLDRESDIRGITRIVMPAIMAFVAILLSVINPMWSLVLFLIAIYFNLVPSNARFVGSIIHSFFLGEEEKILTKKASKNK